MLAKDVVTVNLWAELLALSIIAREAAVAMGNVDATVGGTLEGTEHAGAGGGAGQANVQVCPESARSSINIFNIEVFTVGFNLTLVCLVKVELFQEPSGQKQSSAVGCSIVGEADLDTVPGQLVGVGSTHHHVTLDARIHNLGNNVLVCEAYNHAVLGGVVLVLVLEDQALPGIVVGNTLSPPLEFDLISLEVCLVLYNFDESHFYLIWSR